MKHDQKLDQSLLLLSHGELSGFSKLATEAHLIVCQGCQTRMRELGSTSKQISDVFGMNAGSIPAQTILLQSIRIKFTVYLAAIVVIVGSVIGGVVVHKNTARISNAVNMHCRPGIVSDQCR